MTEVALAHEVDWDGFRALARSLATDGVPPEWVTWAVREPPDLFSARNEAAPATPAVPFTLPRALVGLAQTMIQARDAERFALLYGLIWRAHRGERQIVEQTGDPAVARAIRLAQSVRHDTDRMRAELRFRAAPDGAGERQIAWCAPEHFIVEANAAFFARRDPAVTWSILAPYRAAHWDGAALAFGPGAATPAEAAAAPRIIAAASKYWRSLPQAPAEPARGEGLVQQPAAPSHPAPTSSPRPPPPVPGSRLAQAAAEAASCRRCALGQHATQTVWGEGPADAAIMFVGEQPGDQEDLAGRPFVGPAGQLFDRALHDAGLDRSSVYITNAVKHFKFERRGRRRIHAKPETPEIVACAPWLELERTEVLPRLIVLLGATAARAVLGRAVAITRERGRTVPLGNGAALVTVHPSYLLRLPDEAAKAREYAAFVADLRLAGRLAAADPPRVAGN